MIKEIIIGKRQSGKTTALINKASQENLYIVVANRQRALSIANQARRMNKNILFPITIEELPLKMYGNYYVRNIGKVLVDDADDVLEIIIGMQIESATFTAKE